MKPIFVALILVASFAGSAQAQVIFNETFSASGGTAYDQAPTAAFTAPWGKAATATIAGGS
ncbi:MAG: hypothetical protein SGJ20_19605 [Planctomycetota bacterium]|nr:hypothetical protein [Planctomycetota bacterium]